MVEVKLRSFESQILYFNGMYKLPVAPYPTVFSVMNHGEESVYARLCNFKDTLLEEIHEIDEITNKFGDAKQVSEIEVLTELADLLGDIIIYCASEMAKFGIPYNKTLSIIMQSNFSKLDAEGNPIYNDLGKVMKGPHYYKPEPELEKMLKDEIMQATASSPGLER